MSMLTRLAATGAAPTVYVDDVFSTFLYTGNFSSQTITNGIDLSGKGGMVWSKTRDGPSNTSHSISDTNTGVGTYLSSNSTAASSTGSGLSGLLSNGYQLNGSSYANYLDQIYISWTFRKQAKFFDVVTYTGDGTSLRAISHSLGSVPGLVVVKATSTTGNWFVAGLNASGTYYRTDATGGGALNASSAPEGPFDFVGLSFLTNSTFVPQTVAAGRVPDGNANGVSYVAYLFAHDTSASGLIRCGSYTGNGSSTGPTVTLDWEPQWLMIKRATGGTGNWNIFDNMRGMTVGGDDWYLEANTADAEASANWITPTASGFQIVSTSTEVNNNTDTYIYVAIRRSNKPPTAGTQVFQPTVYTGTNVDNRLVDTTIAPDMVWVRQRDDTVLGGMVVGDRLRGQPYQLTGTTDAEVNDADALDQQIVSATEYGTAFSAMNGFYCGNDATAKLNTNTTSNNHVALAFKRAAKFFDVVCYTGIGGGVNNVRHNLAVPPELIIAKARTYTGANYNVWHVGGIAAAGYMTFNSDAAQLAAVATTTTSTTFNAAEVGSADNYPANAGGETYVAYLFTSLSGVSKIGTYTGNGGTVNTNGTSQTINCGFSAGARFVLIKRRNSTGGWYIFDSARGIVAASDPYLLMNSTAAEVTTVDAVDADNSGFIVNQTSGTNLNVTSATYIYLAIA